MGYRHYIAKISRKEGDKILRCTNNAQLIKVAKTTAAQKKELISDYGSIEDAGTYGILMYHSTLSIDDILCLGKGFEEGFDIENEYPQLVPYNTESEDKIVIIDRAALRIAIEQRLGCIRAWLNGLVCPIEDATPEETDKVHLRDYKQDVEQKIRMWKDRGADSDPMAIDLDPKSIQVSGGSLYEYEIFDLIAIYKFFDFDKNYLLFYGR